MKKINQFLLLIYFGLFVLGCKSLVTKQLDTNNTAVTDSVKIPDFELHSSDSDSVLINRLVEYNDKICEIDSSCHYYDGRVFYPKDSIFKVINLFGEFAGGATYNPYAKGNVIRGNKIYQQGISGETFRIDKKTDSTYVFYVDDYWRLGSNFSIYNATFSKDSLLIKETDTYPNFVFGLINNTKESPEAFPKNIFDLFPKDEHKIKNDTAASGFDGNYYPEQEFLSRNGTKLYTQLSFRKKFGEQIEKIVRITTDDTINKEIVLAMRGGDSDSYTLSSEFVNDSIFIQSLVNQETIKDDNEGMGYAYDSIITKYRYNHKFDLDIISKDTLRYEKEFVEKNGSHVERQTYYSRLFTINKLECFWKTEIEILFDDNGESLRAKNIIRKLINRKTKKVILTSDEDVIVHNETAFFETIDDNFKDFNFDGYLDFSIYNQYSSGASHTFFDNYLFNPKTKQFEYSKELSNAEITIDKNLKTTTLFYSMGRMYHHEKIIHYNEKGNILYIESYIDEEKKGKNSDQYYILHTYLKKKNGKVIKRTVTRSDE